MDVPLHAAPVAGPGVTGSRPFRLGGGPPSGAAAYAIAAVAVLAAAALASLLAKVAVEPSNRPFSVSHAAGRALLLGAVALGAIFGRGPGLLAAALAAAAVLLGPVLPIFSPLPRGYAGYDAPEILRDGVSVAAFVAVAAFVGSLAAARRRAEDALRERDLRLRLVSEQIPAGLWSTDAELRITSGFGSGLMLGGQDFHVTAAGRCAPADPGADADLGLLAHLRSDDPDCPAVAAHRRALRGDSSTYEIDFRGRTFQCHVEPLRNTDGRIIGVVGVALDITDRKRAERNLQEAKEDAEQARAQAEASRAQAEASRAQTEASRAQAEAARAQAEAATRAKDRFLAMLSHELRTPLTPALAAASSLLESADHAGLSADAREDLEMIRRNIELEARLIDDLLDLTRISQGKLELRARAVDAQQLLHSALDICRQDLDGKSIRVTVDAGAEHAHVRADPARLQQVFWNLLKNAAKFTPAGGAVRVRSWNTPAAQDGAPPRLTVEVSDTGIGIEPEALQHVFNAFEQGSRTVTRRYGGLGLGLAISKAVIDAHAGRLTAASPGLGRGATFWLELETVAAPEPAELPAPGAPPGAGPLERALAGLGAVPPASPPAPRASPVRVLLVEDDDDTLRVLARLLRGAGYVVATASTLEAALRIARDEPFDVIVSDLGLPDGSGLDLMRHINARLPLDGDGRATKGIALSGYGMEADLHKSTAAGFVRHLTKPIDFRTLDEAIEEVTS